MRSLLLLLLLCASPALAQNPAKSATGAAALPAGPTQQAAALASLAEGDENWDGRFGLPSIGFNVYTVAVAPNGDVYVGGSLSYAGASSIGTSRVKGIVRWDGRRWHALGEGIDGVVHAIAFGLDGKVYVGGSFATAGTSRVNSIARWDPQAGTWSALGQGMLSGTSPGTVRALAFRGAELYAGGSFEKSGAAPMQNLARWDGLAWQNLGQNLGRFDFSNVFQGNGGSQVNALHVNGSDVYVGGSFEAVATGRSYGVARFNAGAGTWHAMGGGVRKGSTYDSAGRVSDITTDAANNVYVVGDFDETGLYTTPGPSASYVAKWNGTAWSALGTGLQAQFFTTTSALAFVGGALYVTGNFDTAGGERARSFARWDGNAWTEPGGGLVRGSGASLAPDANGGLYLVGSFSYVGNTDATDGKNMASVNVVRWSGTAFEPLGQGLGYSSIRARTYAIAVSGGLVYAGGFPTHAGGKPVNNIAAWNGATWTALGAGTGGSDGTVRALAAGPDGSIYAGGSFTTAGGRSGNHVAKWNPATREWSALGSGVNGDVYALVVGPDGTVYAGGSFTASGAVETKYVAKWNGTAWAPLGTGMNYYVESLALAADGKLYAGGDFNKVGNDPANGIAVWNGTNWSALGEGLKSRFGSAADANSIVVVGEDVYVAGDFVTAGTSAAAGVAKWRAGTGWSALDAGLGGGSQEGNALARVGNLVYVGGNFETAGGQASPGVALWDAGSSTWSPLGSGTAGGTVHTLAMQGNALFVGGDFDLAGGKASSGIGLWNGQAAAQAARLVLDAADVNFGDVTVGTPADRTVTLRNDAAATADLTGTITLGAGPFALVAGGGAFTLAPGASRAVTVRFTPAAEGVATASLAVQHNGGNTASPAAVALRGAGAARGGRIVVRNFDAAGPQNQWADANGNFLFGTNSYGDRSKATAFVVPAGKNAGGTVSEVRVWFTYKDPLAGAAAYTLRLYAGDAQSGPTGTPLYSKTYPISGIAADDDPATVSGPTVHTLGTPVAVTGSFFAVVDFGAYPSTNTKLATLAAGARIAARVPEVWEQWSDNTWHNLSDAWTGTQSAAGTGTAGWQMWVEADLVMSTAGEGELIADALVLDGAAPNPFRGRTEIRYGLDRPGRVTLDVFDVTGRRVATLVDADVAAGRHAASFDASALASGVYVCRLRTGTSVLTRTITVLR